jgi:hypothetical protein
MFNNLKFKFFYTYIYQEYVEPCLNSYKLIHSVSYILQDVQGPVGGHRGERDKLYHPVYPPVENHNENFHPEKAKMRSTSAHNTKGNQIDRGPPVLCVEEVF